MKININKTQEVLISRFISHGFSSEVAISMSRSIVRSELFGKTTHGLIRYNWIIKNKISKEYSYQNLEISDNMTIIDCSQKNGYYLAQKEVEDICQKLTCGIIHHISILKNIFPTNALIDYLEKFHRENIGAIIISTTPRLVGIRGSGKRIVGTNPIGYTFPNSNSIILADLSTSNVPLGKIIEKYSEIQDEIVLSPTGELISPEKAFNQKNEFIGTLLPFGGINGEHKGLCISLLIEFITTILSGKRSDMGDMIIFAFSKKHPLYNSQSVNELILSLSAMESDFRFPGLSAYNYYKMNIENGYIDIDDKTFKFLNFSSDEINKVKYER